MHFCNDSLNNNACIDYEFTFYFQGKWPTYTIADHDRAGPLIQDNVGLYTCKCVYLPTIYDLQHSHHFTYNLTRARTNYWIYVYSLYIYMIATILDKIVGTLPN